MDGSLIPSPPPPLTHSSRPAYLGDDPFYESDRRHLPEDLPRTMQMARIETPAGEGGGGGSGAGGKRESPLDKEQEGDKPFAINVKVTGQGIGNDWSTALVEVLSGTYDTYVGAGGPFNANNAVFPAKALSVTVNNTASDYKPYVYLAVPLRLTDAASGVRATDGRFYHAIDGGIVVLSKLPTEWTWPNVLDPAGSAPPRTAIKIGTWGIEKHNISPGGVPTYVLRMWKQQEVSDNIVIGQPYGGSDRLTKVMIHLPWSVVQATPTTADIKQALLLTNVVTNTYATVTGLTGLALGSATKYWLKATFAAGVPTGWEVTTTDPAGDLITWTGDGSPGSPFVQTGYWYPIGRVVAGSQPQISGFDFISGGTAYHLEQLCSVRLAVIRPCINGRLTYMVSPY